jgi:rhomboid protease GluP
MPLKRVFRENWLTRKPLRDGFVPTVVLVFLLVCGRLAEYPASGELVFTRHEYWRAWTTLFVHEGPGHLLGNLFLFIPFAYVLTSYFGLLLWPLAGFFVGGLVNLVVLKTMPAQVMLIGASGVVYWMGAAWITLAFLVDRREKRVRRLLKALGVSMLLFLPETYRPEVSYLTHLLGYFAGIASALVYFGFRRHEFLAAEKVDFKYDFDAHWDPSINGYSEELPEDFVEEACTEGCPNNPGS